MKHAFVTTNLLDLWAEPRYNCERASQLLFGELVRTGAVRKGFVRVVQPDGYAGWVDSRFLRPIARPVAPFRKAAEAVVSRGSVKITGKTGRGSVSPHFLYYGTRVRVISRRAATAACVLPDGTEFRVASRALVPISERKKGQVKGTDLVREAGRFLGVPYLWGGISPAGFDCSGLVRTVLSRFGVYVPRDTKDQIKVGTPVERTSVRTGDLLFFKRHVGLALGAHRVIHASMGGSGVRINSLRPGEEDYRPDLDRDFAAARRIL